MKTVGLKRKDGRSANELRPISCQFDIYPNAAGSVLYAIGKTQILCSVIMQPGVPAFLRGTRTGWLTANYSMLPASTQKRNERESGAKPNGRYMEISRLIGRSLRAVVDVASIGERTITIDCDVLQADGGTRTASVTAACLALKMAEQTWLRKGIITQAISRDVIAGVSVGFCNGVPVLDPNCDEDSSGQADVNFVLTKSGAIIEIQGTAETSPISYESFNAMYTLACAGVSDIMESIEKPSEPVIKQQTQKVAYKFGTLGSILQQKTE
ncbi:MAG: ribonuclease PH [Candidatus Babeliales bacterium]